MSPGPSISIVTIHSEKETTFMDLVLCKLVNKEFGAAELCVTLEKIREAIARFLGEQMEPGGNLFYF